MKSLFKLKNKKKDYKNLYFYYSKPDYIEDIYYYKHLKYASQNF